MRIARTLPALVLLAFAAVPALAQGKPTPAPAVQQARPADASMSVARDLWGDVRDWILTAARQTPDSEYAYRPTPGVRSLGEIYAHVAGSQFMFCAMGLGEKPPAEGNVEKTAHTKAEIVAALEASNAYCAKAYAQSDARGMEPVKVFGEDRTRLFALTMNATHDNEHYGNIVTYTRMLGRVPPSSQPTH